MKNIIIYAVLILLDIFFVVDNTIVAKNSLLSQRDKKSYEISSVENIRDTVSVNIKNSVNLRSLLANYKDIKTLKISGVLKPDDVLYIKELATNSKLINLDLKYALPAASNWIYYTNQDEYAPKSYFNLSQTNLVNVKLPEAMLSIPKGSFKNCINLKKVTFSKSLSSVGSEAFYGCCDLDSIYIENIKSIGFKAFYSCTDLRYLYLGENQCSISSGNFIGWYTSISDKELSIDESAFENCRSLSSVYIDNKVEINKNAFSNCDSLKFVCLPSVTSIGASSFQNCKQLKDVYLGRLIKEIGSLAFKDCISLYRIGMLCGDKPKWNNVINDSNLNPFINTPKDKKIIIIKGRYNDWKEDTYCGAKNIVEVKTFFVRAANGVVIDGHYDIVFQ